jgi:hypothetical protein
MKRKKPASTHTAQNKFALIYQKFPVNQEKNVLRLSNMPTSFTVYAIIGFTNNVDIAAMNLTTIIIKVCAPSAAVTDTNPALCAM